jgi:hypothetical protein
MYFDGASQLTLDQSLITAYPAMMFAVSQRLDEFANQTVIAISDKDDSDRYAQLQVQGAIGGYTHVSKQRQDGGADADQDITNETAQQNVPAAGLHGMVNNTDRSSGSLGWRTIGFGSSEYYVESTGATSVIADAWDRFALGGHGCGSALFFFQGEIFVGIWYNTYLATSAARHLLLGQHPLGISPGNIKAYVPCWSNLPGGVNGTPYFTFNGTGIRSGMTNTTWKLEDYIVYPKHGRPPFVRRVVGRRMTAR